MADYLDIINKAEELLAQPEQTEQEVKKQQLIEKYNIFLRELIENDGEQLTLLKAYDIETYNRLKDALAYSEQEPDAQMLIDKETGARIPRAYKPECEPNKDRWEMYPLYTAPPKREPLSTDFIDDLTEKSFYAGTCDAPVPDDRRWCSVECRDVAERDQ